MELMYGCGSNLFQQLSSITNSVNSESERQHPKCFKTPVLLKKLTKSEKVLKSAFTWSRFVVTVQSEKEVCTQVSGFASAQTSNNTPSVQSVAGSQQKYPGKVLSAVTDGNIILCHLGQSTPTHLLRDGENDVVPVCLEKGKDQDVAITAVAGAHQDLYVAYDGLCFGRLSSDKGESSGSETESAFKDSSVVFSLLPIDSGISITSISCGKEHALLLSKHGTVYSYGLGSRGQLGHSTVEKEPAPRLIEALEGLKVKALSAGGWHSAAVTDTGDLYTWGWNESGQLGHPALNLSSQGGRRTSVSQDDIVGIQAEPRCAFDLTSEEMVSSVSCGSRHTLCLTETGQVFASGWNGYGQLGLGHLTNVDKFTHVDKIQETCVAIVAGQWNSLFVCKV